MISALMAPVLAAVGLLAQEPSPEPNPAPAAGALILSLPDALSRAEQSAPDVVIAARLVPEAEATKVGAGIRLPSNPRLSFDARPKFGSPSETGYSASLDLAFEVANAAGARLAEGDRRIGVARDELRVARLEARAVVFHSYVDVRLQELRVEQERAALALAERVGLAAQERLSAGAGNEIETTSAQADIAESRAALQIAISDRQAAETRLRFLLGLPLSQPVVLTSEISDPEAAPPTRDLQALAAQAHPEMRLIKSRIALQDATDLRLAREAKPKLGVFGALDASPASPKFGIVGLSIDLPFAQRNQGPRAVARAVRATEEVRLTTELQRAESAIAALHISYDGHRAAALTLATQGIPAAQRRVELVETGWRAGRFDILRLTAVRQDLVRLRHRFLSALELAWLERIALERVVGTWPGR